MLRKLSLAFIAAISVTTISAMDSVFRDLPPEAVAHMDRQRAFVAEFAARHGLPKITGTKADFDVLHEIVFQKLIPKEETWQLQSLGVVFGDALLSVEPQLHWMEVTDNWGTDPALLWGDTTYQLNPVTMISKRVEDGVEAPFVHSLARTVLELVRENGPKADKR